MNKETTIEIPRKLLQLKDSSLKYIVLTKYIYDDNSFKWHAWKGKEWVQQSDNVIYGVGSLLNENYNIGISMNDIMNKIDTYDLVAIIVKLI